jgi:hypothetical protein
LTASRGGSRRRAGVQEAPALLVPRSTYKSPEDLRPFAASSWYEICGKLCEDHLLAGTRVEEVKSWKRATSYMEKYVAKPEQFPEGVETGRVWGVWSKDLLPVQWETVKVSLKDAYGIRRIYRRLAKMRGRGHLHRLTVFVRHENVVRLLEFLGYPQEEQPRTRVVREEPVGSVSRRYQRRFEKFVDQWSIRALRPGPASCLYSRTA